MVGEVDWPTIDQNVAEVVILLSLTLFCEARVVVTVVRRADESAVREVKVVKTADLLGLTKAIGATVCLTVQTLSVIDMIRRLNRSTNHQAVAVIEVLLRTNAPICALAFVVVYPRNQRVGPPGHTKELKIVLWDNDDVPSLMRPRPKLVIERLEDVCWLATDGKFVSIIYLVSDIVLVRLFEHGQVALLMAVCVAKARQICHQGVFRQVNRYIKFEYIIKEDSVVVRLTQIALERVEVGARKVEVIVVVILDCNALMRVDFIVLEQFIIILALKALRRVEISFHDGVISSDLVAGCIVSVGCQEDRVLVCRWVSLQCKSWAEDNFAIFFEYIRKRYRAVVERLSSGVIRNTLRYLRWFL